MTNDELIELVAALRDQRSDTADIEAKRAKDALPKSTRETLSSFSNTRGGVLILGLSEEQRFEASGVTDAAKICADLASMCAQEMEPPLRPLIETMQFEGVALVVAEIPELDPASKPCFYKGAGITQGSYIRVNDADQLLSSYEVQMLIASRGQPTEDKQPILDAGVDSLDPQMVSEFCDRLRRTRARTFAALDNDEILSRLGVIVSVDGKTCPTLAGLLSMGLYPQQFFPQLMVSFVSYPSVDGSLGPDRFIDDALIEGSIPVMVDEAMTVLRRNMSRRSIVSGSSRKSVWEYPETALREAIVNAIVHRDLSSASRGTQVQIEMYPDRLEIKNPGGLFGPVSITNLGQDGVSSSRNSSLLKILEDVNIPGVNGTVCENRGSGIRAMVASLRAAGMAAPAFQNSISQFRVIVPNHALLSDDVVKWITGLGEDGLTESQITALAIFRLGESLDNSRYRLATGVDSRVATHELRDLVARELVVQAGGRRWATYRLSEKVSAQPKDVAAVASRRRQPADRRQEILKVIGSNELSRAQIVHMTGLNDQVVTHWLRILRKENLVVFAGAQSPQSKHVRYIVRPGTEADVDQTAFDFL